jgi:hypothetical protein
MLSPYNRNVLQIPSGVDTRRFFPAREASRDSLPAILMSGRVIDALKGFPTVRQACDRLWEQGRRFRLLITEQFPVDGEAPYLEKLGWLDQNQLPELYRRCDISLAPSIWVEPSVLPRWNPWPADCRSSRRESAVWRQALSMDRPAFSSNRETAPRWRRLLLGFSTTPLTSASRRRGKKTRGRSLRLGCDCPDHYLPLVNRLMK